MSRERNARMIRAYENAWRALQADTGCDLVEEDGLLSYFSGASAGAFNPTLVVAPPRDPRAAIKAAEERYRTRRVPFGFEIPIGFDDATEDAARALGFRLHRTVVGMAMHPVPQLPGSAHDVRRVTAPAEFDDHRAVQAAGFGSPRSEIDRFMHPAVVGGASRLFLGYDDGVPVATSMVTISGRDAGIFAVATLPSHRRRGFGRALTRAGVLFAAEAGCDFVFLHATDAGLPVYRAMGFEPTVESRIYLAPEF